MPGEPQNSLICKIRSELREFLPVPDMGETAIAYWMKKEFYVAHRSPEKSTDGFIENFTL